MRVKRGLNSTRVRRRQSDAKWRASVASCYDTLKFVAPDSGNIPKRKLSKAAILQRTDKHIRELEKGVSALLTLEADKVNKSVFWNTGKQLVPATISHIRKEFEEKQSLLFEQSIQGRRRYSMLADIEDEILHMNVDTGRFTVLSKNRGGHDLQQKTRIKQIPVNRRTKILRKELVKSCTISRQGKPSTNDHMLTAFDLPFSAPVICERLPNAGLFHHSFLDPTTCPLLHASADDMSLSTPSKVSFTDSDDLFSPVAECLGFTTPVYNAVHRVDTKPPLTSSRLSKVAKQLDFTIDETDFNVDRSACAILDRSSDMSSLFGFTPIKLPSDSDLGFTPLKPILSALDEKDMNLVSPMATSEAQCMPYPSQPKIYVNEEIEDQAESDQSLLCLESFDAEPEDQPEWERTPEKDDSEGKVVKKRLGKKDQCKRRIAFGGDRLRKIREHAPKCRKNLEQMYPKNDLPIITGVFDKETHCSDFDGYFLFYRQVVDELQQHITREEIASPSVATFVSQMWSDMTEADKQTLSTLAALEGSQDSNSSSNLSEDLKELDVKPLDSHIFDVSKISQLKADLQTVPTSERTTIKSIMPNTSDELDNQTVPSCHFDFKQRVPLSQSLPNYEVDHVPNCRASISVCGDFSDTDVYHVVPDISNIVKKDVLLSSSQSPMPLSTYTQT